MTKNAVIFGASSGIGKELAKLLVAGGFHVLITGRREEKLRKIQATNPEKYSIKKHDVTQIETLEEMFKEFVASFKTIDLIIYSSGVADPNYELDWDKEVPTLDTNVIGATKVFGLAYNLFRQQGFGHLVAISSIAGLRGNRNVPAYFASKAYQNNYLESLWMKAKRSKATIFVTDIAPGFVDTKMALGDTFWMASPEKAARQIYSAIKRKKKKVYITKRWAFIAFFMRIAPATLINKLS